jgi:uncharacterized protein
MPTIEQARAWSPAGDPVHGFDHVERVVRMAERLAREVGADQEIVRAAALVHDAAGAHPEAGEARHDHEQDSAAVARRVLTDEGWPEERIRAVEHCIRAHRFRGKERPQTLEAQVLFDADKLDVMGAFGAARTIGYALQAGAPIYATPSRAFLDRGERESGEPCLSRVSVQAAAGARQAVYRAGTSDRRAAASRAVCVLRSTCGRGRRPRLRRHERQRMVSFDRGVRHAGQGTTHHPADE